MKTQKAIATTMILTSSVLTGLASRDFAYPAILCILGLLGLRRRFTWNIRPERRVIKSFLLLFLAAMFALQYRYTGFSSRFIYDQAAAVAWQTIARYFLASMILILYLGSPQRLPSSLGLFHIAVTISAGQVLLLDDFYLAFRLSEILSVILLILYATTSHESRQTLIPVRARRTSRGLAFGLIFLVAINTGWITGTLLYGHVEVVNYLPVWLWGPGTNSDDSTNSGMLAGFSKSGKLSSILIIKGDLDPSPVLNIRSDNSPGYLRACAFEHYRRSEWSDSSNKQEIIPQRNQFGIYLPGRRNTFRLDASDLSNCEHLTIKHVSRFADALFTPLGTSAIEAPFAVILKDNNDIVYAPSLRVGLTYHVAFRNQAHRKPPTEVQYRRMRDVPTRLDPRVRELAKKIFAGCTTTAEKIDAVVKHFHTNYTYTLGVDVPPDAEDKVSHFLLESSSGYCEYFASGAAVLLRLAEVPTRYVTGFLVTEFDDVHGLWVARNMDAHAWVEAWDRDRNQWTLVEATVGEDATVAGSGEEIERLGGGGALLRQLMQAIYEYGLLGVPGWLFESYGVLTGTLILTGLFAAVMACILSRFYSRRKATEATPSKTIRNPILISLHKMLLRMDRNVKAAGSHREPNETLHAFSQRLKKRYPDAGVWTKIADWYREFALLRYQKMIHPEHVEQLEQRAQGLQDSL